MARECNVQTDMKRDCGHSGTQQQDCEASGCCWQPATAANRFIKFLKLNTPWCFHPAGEVDSCSKFNFVATSTGFTDDFYNKMYENFVNNINVDGVGAVVASRDTGTPGGSYFFNWMRDAALSIKVFMEINDNDYNRVKDVMESYTNWVGKVQNQEDPNGNDVRIEPKFEIPSGKPYTGGWCRPQTDGPGLRANSLSQWGQILITAGQQSYASEHVLPLVKKDLDWVTQNWESDGCDLWEEVRSNDFFWGRSSFVFALNNAADFCDSIGDSCGQNYRSVAGNITNAIRKHWTGNFIYESENRDKDGSVIHAIASFGKYLFKSSSNEAASTVNVYNKVFCEEYSINQQDNKNGVPGVLYGRYQNDSYAGGNPWPLLTAGLAELFYNAANEVYDQVKSDPNFKLGAEHNKWLEVLNLENGISAMDLVKGHMNAGDAVMSRLWKYVKNDNGRVDEQIGKSSGVQVSAKGLTWSYANILHALHTRKSVQKKMGLNGDDM